MMYFKSLFFDEIPATKNKNPLVFLAPFQICSRTLSSKHKLKRHMLVHTKAQPFQCQLCHTRFKEAGNLAKHVARAHKKEEEDGGTV